MKLPKLRSFIEILKYKNINNYLYFYYIFRCLNIKLVSYQDYKNGPKTTISVFFILYN